MMRTKNSPVARLFASGPLHQVATVRGMQNFLRTTCSLNHRYFRQDIVSRIHFNHVALMIAGMCVKFTKKEFLVHWNDLGTLLYDLYDEIEEDITHEKRRADR